MRVVARIGGQTAETIFAAVSRTESDHAMFPGVGSAAVVTGSIVVAESSSTVCLTLSTFESGPARVTGASHVSIVLNVARSIFSTVEIADQYVTVFASVAGVFAVAVAVA